MKNKSNLCRFISSQMSITIDVLIQLSEVNIKQGRFTEHPKHYNRNDFKISVNRGNKSRGNKPSDNKKAFLPSICNRNQFFLIELFNH